MTAAAARKPRAATPRKVTKGELSRTKLLEAAARVFVKKGFAQTTIRDIAKEAGVALGALYFHFPSKDEFATAVFEQGITAIWEHVEQDIAALPPGTDARTRIEAALRSHILATLDHGDYAVAIRFARDSLAPAAVQRRYRQTVDRYRQIWQNLIEEGQRAGIVRKDMTAGKVLFFVFGSVNWLSEWYDPKRAPIDEMIRDFSTLLFQGIKPPTP